MRFDVGRCVAYARGGDPEFKVMQVSAETGEGVEGCCNRLCHAPGLVPA